jgi:hypothetical protein
MDRKELKESEEAAAKSIKAEAGLNELRQMLTKITVGRTLNISSLETRRCRQR